jgi:prepilin-type N-terminal cleavage/methylation domain-containing protein
MKRAFSLVELMIVVAVLGILAAIVVPQFQEHSVRAKEAVAKDSLRLLRGAIELYAARHGGVPPGYKDDDPGTAPGDSHFNRQVIVEGRYLSEMPENPFNTRQDVKMIGNSEAFPGDPSGGFGWVYQPATKTIRLDWPGTDKNAIRYFDY